MEAKFKPRIRGRYIDGRLRWTFGGKVFPNVGAITKALAPSEAARLKLVKRRSPPF